MADGLAESNSRPPIGAGKLRFTTKPQQGSGYTRFNPLMYQCSALAERFRVRPLGLVENTINITRNHRKRPVLLFFPSLPLSHKLQAEASILVSHHKITTLISFFVMAEDNISSPPARDASNPVTAYAPPTPPSPHLAPLFPPLPPPSPPHLSPPPSPHPHPPSQSLA